MCIAVIPICWCNQDVCISWAGSFGKVAYFSRSQYIRFGAIQADMVVHPWVCVSPVIRAHGQSLEAATPTEWGLKLLLVGGQNTSTP